MTTESEVKLARYSERSKESDEMGRLITVRRLTPSEQTKLSGMTAELTGHETMVNEQGETVKISHRMPLLIAASVCMIDETHIPFPKTRGELDAIYDRLDVEGIEAAGKAFTKMVQKSAVIEPLDETKNLSGTPSSA